MFNAVGPLPRHRALPNGLTLAGMITSRQRLQRATGFLAGVRQGKSRVGAQYHTDRLGTPGPATHYEKRADTTVSDADAERLQTGIPDDNALSRRCRLQRLHIEISQNMLDGVAPLPGQRWGNA